MKNKNTSLLQNGTVRIALGTALILLIPVILQWPWGILDFTVIGMLLFATGSAVNWVGSNVNKKYRVVAILAILGLAFLIWAELAVDLVSQIVSGEIWTRLFD